MQYSLREIGQRLACEVPPAAADKAITGVATLDDAGPGDISFLGSPRYFSHFKKTRAGAVIAKKGLKLSFDGRIPILMVNDADLAIAKVLEMFAPPLPKPPAGVDPSARVAPSAQIGPATAIGPNVVIAANSRVGSNCVFHPNVVIGEDVTIGDGCTFYPNVVIRERITIGNRVIIHAGSMLGSDGFGYRWNGKRHEKIPQIGTVVIEDDVEIGSCVCIDRAKFSTTRVGAGTKIDNLVQIGHNVQIGKHCIIVGQVGIAGSAVLGDGVVLGGQAAVRDHIRMGTGSTAAARAGVAQDVDAGATVSGLPALPHRQSLREQAAMRRLPELLVQMRKLTEEVKRLKRR